MYHIRMRPQRKIQAIHGWRDDPENAPYGEPVLAYGQGGITIKALDENGNWRGRSGLSDQNPGALGRPKAAPTHWMLLPLPPE